MTLGGTCAGVDENYLTHHGRKVHQGATCCLPRHTCQSAHLLQEKIVLVDSEQTLREFSSTVLEVRCQPVSISYYRCPSFHTEIIEPWIVFQTVRDAVGLTQDLPTFKLGLPPSTTVPAPD